MGEESIQKVLKDFGLTGKEIAVYIFLAKYGLLKGGDIARQIKVNKAQVYHILKSLQKKGLVELTLESPTRFVAVPFATVLDLYIKTRQEEAILMKSSKDDLLREWIKINNISFEQRLEKFMVIEGDCKIYPRISQMVNETKHQFSVVSSVAELVRADRYGVLDMVLDSLVGSAVQFRLITDITEQNLDSIKVLMKRAPKKMYNFKGRNPNLGLKLFPRMIIKDEEEILFFVSGPDAPIGEAICLWTNCMTLVQSFMIIFDELWQNATIIQAKISEIETEKSTPPMQIITSALTNY